MVKIEKQTVTLKVTAYGRRLELVGNKGDTVKDLAHYGRMTEEYLKDRLFTWRNDD